MGGVIGLSEQKVSQSRTAVGEDILAAVFLCGIEYLWLLLFVGGAMCILVG